MSQRKAPRRGVAAITIECIAPELDGGRHPVKRFIGDTVTVSADIFKDGHDLLAAHVLVRPAGQPAWAAPFRYEYNPDRWFAEFTVDRIGRWHFSIEAWTDVWATWQARLQKKIDARQETALEFREAAQLIRAAARRARPGPERAALTQSAKAFDHVDDTSVNAVVRRALGPDLAELLHKHLLPRDLTRYDHEIAVVVDRERARFASWYELFPRSTDRTGGHGTFATTCDELPRVASLGFDVLYLPPIHPIGRSFRKGKNNSLTPEPDDVGSPWAIGNELGGHDAIDPQLGTIEDFDRLVAAAREHDIEIALDYALQCSPDHPWVKEHPEWFHQRSDGSIAYAENPPKKYQDIYPLNFWCADRARLWEACRDVVLHWVSHGVKTFRVDNPHTKPFAFWEWLIADVQAVHPDVIFFAEAFTRPKRMKGLAKLGFTMSYTYFTWKNTSWELRDYLTELNSPQVTEYFRGNFFVNTPDILTEYLVRGGRPAFLVRLVIAATASPLWGMYSGYELLENVPLREGSEEYLHSEKYQLKPRDWEAQGNIAANIALLNRVRRENRALQQFGNLTVLPSENENVLFYRRSFGSRLSAPGARHSEHTEEAAGVRHPERSEGTAGSSLRSEREDSDILIAVNLDPQAVQASTLHVPIAEMGIAPDEPYVLHDLLSDARFTWQGERAYVRLDPNVQVAHVLRVER